MNDAYTMYHIWELAVICIVICVLVASFMKMLKSVWRCITVCHLGIDEWWYPTRDLSNSVLQLLLRICFCYCLPLLKGLSWYSMLNLF